MTFRDAATMALEDGRPDVALVWAVLATRYDGKDSAGHPFDEVSDSAYRAAIATRPLWRGER